MNIAIIDDKEDIKYAVEKILKKQGHTCYRFDGTEEELIEGLETFEINLIILDMMLAKSLTGLDVIKRVRKHNIDTPIVIITAYTTPSNIIKASKAGVIDIIQKPFSTEDIVQIVAKYTQNVQKKHRQLELKEEQFIGSFETMQDIYKDIGIASSSILNTLIIGDTGTGKELVAKLIHKNSKQCDEPFVAINCATIPENLFERLMYGRVENFSKNQNEVQEGYIQQVGFGTLFLDEISELHINLQPKLLRFLETKSFYPLGSSRELTFNGRVICASLKTKEELSNPHLFRNDLYHRIATFEIEVPNLNKRKNDIEALVTYFITQFCSTANIKEKSITKEAIDFLKECDFKGNVRELKNLIHKTMHHCRNELIALEDIQNNVPKNINSKSLFLENVCKEILGLYDIKESKTIFEDFEQKMLKLMLQKCNNISQLAQHLGITRNTLKTKLKKYHIDHK